jgi:hypothetical protein
LQIKKKKMPTAVIIWISVAPPYFGPQLSKPLSWERTEAKIVEVTGCHVMTRNEKHDTLMNVVIWFLHKRSHVGYVTYVDIPHRAAQPSP